MAVDEKLVVEETSLLFPVGNDITGVEDELSRNEDSAFG